jgi:hypothetical protein
MRASVVGTTDISTNSAAFVAMAGTTLTFTPNKSTVYITASASGYNDVNKNVPSVNQVQLYNVTSGTVIAGGTQIGQTIYKAGTTTYTSTSWSISIATPLTVTPGVAVTIELRWNVQWADGNTDYTYCNANSAPGFCNRNIIVIE